MKTSNAFSSQQNEPVVLFSDKTWRGSNSYILKVVLRGMDIFIDLYDAKSPHNLISSTSLDPIGIVDDERVPTLYQNLPHHVSSFCAQNGLAGMEVSFFTIYALDALLSLAHKKFLSEGLDEPLSFKVDFLDHISITPSGITISSVSDKSSDFFTTEFSCKIPAEHLSFSVIQDAIEQCIEHSYPRYHHDYSAYDKLSGAIYHLASFLFGNPNHEQFDI